MAFQHRQPWWPIKLRYITRQGAHHFILKTKIMGFFVFSMQYLMGCSLLTKKNIGQRLVKLSYLVFCPPSKFKNGDIVRTKDSSHTMRVVRILKERGMTRPIILCEWVEIRPTRRRKNLFNEECLQLIF